MNSLVGNPGTLLDRFTPTYRQSTKHQSSDRRELFGDLCIHGRTPGYDQQGSLYDPT
ncbi:MAG: hypothetical protein M2R45_03297 [Verrucomicrobia subdivision 3 bacterium]|nr:hypothetical protein [Limisphaerales bacterium]MCS1415426.1 hypothetical protein [Limisphaerales bacterium]